MLEVVAVALRICLIVWLSFASPAWAQSWLAAPGSLGDATVTVGHATLRLPPGDWSPVSAVTINPLQSGGQSLYMETKWLAQVSGGRVAATVSVTSNDTRSARGWNADRQCRRRDVVFYANASETDRNYDCMMVNHQIMELGDNPSDTWVATFDKLNAQGTLPHIMVCALFAQASRSRLDFITVHVCFNPTLAGFADDANERWSASDWNQHHIDSKHSAFVDEVTAWARGYRQTVAGAF